jgi:hypothetical protein
MGTCAGLHAFLGHRRIGARIDYRPFHRNSLRAAMSRLSFAGRSAVIRSIAAIAHRMVSPPRPTERLLDTRTSTETVTFEGVF